MRIQIDDEITVYILHFVDDQVVIAKDKDNLESMAKRQININNIQQKPNICVYEEMTALPWKMAKTIWRF